MEDSVMKTKVKVPIVDLILRLILFSWAVTIIFPLIWIILLSLKTNQEFFTGAWSLPETLQWVNYKNAWLKLEISSSMLNTVYYVGVTLCISLFLTTISAYALTRLEWKGRQLIWAVIMLSVFLPGINALVPQFVIMRSLGLTNSLNGLIIFSSFGENVFYLMIMGGFMQTLPKDLEESAYIDGASLFKTFWKIIVPLAKPGIVTIGIFSFISLYNNFLYPFIFLSDQKKYTIGVRMYYVNQMMQYKSNWVTLCAGIVITMIPSLIIYILFQKRIVEGATLGAVKG
jgi:ABC-type sugar transport system, permease component